MSLQGSKEKELQKLFRQGKIVSQNSHRVSQARLSEVSKRTVCCTTLKRYNVETLKPLLIL